MFTSQHIQLLMIIYTEKQAELYIMHVVTYRRSWTATEKHTNRKLCDNEGVSSGVTALKTLCVSVSLSHCAVCLWNINTMSSRFCFFFFARARMGKTEQINKKKRKEKCEARGGTCKSCCCSVIHGGLVSTDDALCRSVCVHLLVGEIVGVMLWTWKRVELSLSADVLMDNARRNKPRWAADVSKRAMCEEKHLMLSFGYFLSWQN